MRNGDPEAGAWLDSSSLRSVEFREGRAFPFVLLYEHEVSLLRNMAVGLLPPTFVGVEAFENI